MANKAEKWKDNAGGKFYVDQQCIDCDLCRETAPASSNVRKRVATPLSTPSRRPKRTPSCAWKPSRAARLRPSVTTATSKIRASDQAACYARLSFASLVNMDVISI
jgi:hypothetical protein